MRFSYKKCCLSAPRRLFKTLCDTLSADESTLFLYLLLHRNADFRTHVLASSDVERVVLPILRTLYRAPESSNHHIYMSLIVLLILSEDDLFNTSVHDVSMKVGGDAEAARRFLTGILQVE